MHQLSFSTSVFKVLQEIYRTVYFKANFHSSVLRAGRKKLLAQVNQLDAINMRGIREKAGAE